MQNVSLYRYFLQTIELQNINHVKFLVFVLYYHYFLLEPDYQLIIYEVIDELLRIVIINYQLFQIHDLFRVTISIPYFKPIIIQQIDELVYFYEIDHFINDLTFPAFLVNQISIFLENNHIETETFFKLELLISELVLF